MSSAEFTEDIKPAYFWDGFNWVKINDPLSTYENIVSASAAAYSSASAYTDSASASIVDYIDNLTTTDIEEGSNLYFTEERSLNTASSALVHDNHSNIIATYDSASYEIILTGTSSGGASVIYTEEQPDITELPVGTIWVDSDAEIVGGGSSGGSGGIGLNNWTENENGDLIPNVANIQSIGSSAFPVKEIYVSGSTIYLGETTLSIEDGELNIDGSKVITESNANENLDLTNYLTLSTASTTYATKQELEEIDLTQTINTASAAAYASASAYVDQEISTLIGGAPETLDTLNEIASALEDNPEVLDLFLTKQEFAGASASFYRWTKTYSGSATVISGVDDNEITLEYDEGYEQVFINGVMIEPSEYTRTSASVITLDEAVQASDVVDIFAYRNAFSTNTYTQAQIDNKYNSFSRWQKIYSASASVITGLDDNSLSLSYTPGYEQVYLNGILLTKDEDYTATNSSTITLGQAVVENDVIEILYFQPFNIADTYTQTEADNKFLTQSSASTTYLTESSANDTYLQQVNAQAPFRNLIINGAMQVAQRGTSVASITTDNYYTADRFRTSIGSMGTWTQSVENDAPTGSGFRKSLKVLCTTADASPAAGDTIAINQRIEGQNLQQIAKGTSSAKELTVSFWVKSNVTGTYIVDFYDNDNTRQISKSYTISSSATWEKKTITIPADTTGAFDNDNALSLFVFFWLGAGTNFTSGTLNSSAWASATNANRAVGQTNLAAATNNYWQVTGVQLEVGAVATPFEFKPFDQELRECQRYFYKQNSVGYFAGNSGNSTVARGSMKYAVRMRANPTITVFSGTYNSGTQGHVYVSNTNSTTNIDSVSQITDDGWDTIARNANLPNSGYLYACSYRADAEL